MGIPTKRHKYLKCQVDHNSVDNLGIRESVLISIPL